MTWQCSVQQWSFFIPFLMLYLTTTFAKSWRRYQHVHHFSTVLQDPVENWPFSSLFDILLLPQKNLSLFKEMASGLDPWNQNKSYKYSPVFAITTQVASCALDLVLNSTFAGKVFFLFFFLQPQMSYVTAVGQMTDTVTTQNKCIISIFIFFSNANKAVLSSFLSLDT